MLVLETICHETIWGGHRIAGFTQADSSKKIGHLYSVFCREGVSNKILNGSDKGKKLNEVFPLWRDQFAMGSYDYFPLTIALTEADENLSVQVHPDDETAQRLEGKPRGKRESWYFLEPPKDGFILNGCTCRDKEESRRFIAEGKYLEMADRLPVKAGDYVFVAPGTLHAITAGSLVYEIEEGADSTYRFYDYDRRGPDGAPRELHIDKALEALNIYNKSIVGEPHDGEFIEETYVVRKIAGQSDYRNTSSTIECLTLVQGRAVCDGVAITPGMTVMLWPGERIEGAEMGLAFAARMREGK